MSADVETIVVGAGAVGLAVARALALAGHEVMVLEQHELIGSETSSRNSEVIHAGIYYPPGSLRATLCVRGKELLYRFCAENSVPHARCGKLLVATQREPAAQARRHQARRRPRTASPIWSRSAATPPARWSRRSPALRPCSRPRPASSTATASCWRWRATSRPTAARWCCAARSSASSATPAGLFRLTTGGDNPGAITCQQPRHLGRPARLQAGAHARPWRTATRRPRPTTPRASTTRSRAARPSSATSIPCPTAPGSACTPPSTSAGAASSAPTSSGSPGIDYSFEPEKLDKFLDFIRSYYPGLEVEPPAPRLHGHPPQALPRGRAGARLRHPRAADSTAWPAWSPSTASRARPHGRAGDRRGRGAACCVQQVRRSVRDDRASPLAMSSWRDGFRVRGRSLLRRPKAHPHRLTPPRKGEGDLRSDPAPALRCWGLRRRGRGGWPRRRRLSSLAASRMTFCAWTAETAEPGTRELAGILDIDPQLSRTVPGNAAARAPKGLSPSAREDLEAFLDCLVSHDSPPQRGSMRSAPPIDHGLDQSRVRQRRSPAASRRSIICE